MSRRVYLDHNASTPVHPEVLAEMLPYFSEHFGNPSSVHGFGREARAGLDEANGDRIGNAYFRVVEDPGGDRHDVEQAGERQAEFTQQSRDPDQHGHALERADRSGCLLGT